MKMAMAIYGHKSASIRVNYTGRNKTAILSDLYAEDPKRGHGAKLMKDVTEHLDEYGYKALLEVHSGSPTMSNRKLVKFYERFGFKRIGPGKPIMMKRNRKK